MVTQVCEVCWSRAMTGLRARLESDGLCSRSPRVRTPVVVEPWEAWDIDTYAALFRSGAHRGQFRATHLGRFAP
jgi:hypothetical protein